MKHKKALFILSLAGLLFSGYLSITKLISEVCAFNEGCPYVLGYPACYYGFVMFIALFVLSSILFFKKKLKNEKSYLKGMFWVSLAGILFSGFLTIQELFFSTCPIWNCSYGLLLPTCFYGLIAYIIIFILAMKDLKK